MMSYLDLLTIKLHIELSYMDKFQLSIHLQRYVSHNIWDLKRIDLSLAVSSSSHCTFPNASRRWTNSFKLLCVKSVTKGFRKRKQLHFSCFLFVPSIQRKYARFGLYSNTTVYNPPFNLHASLTPNMLSDLFAFYIILIYSLIITR